MKNDMKCDMKFYESFKNFRFKHTIKPKMIQILTF